MPSHCGIIGNEYADQMAKEGAEQKHTLHLISSSFHEMYTLFYKYFHKDCVSTTIIPFSRPISRLIYKLKLNTWRTKFVKNITCMCSEKITINHIIFDCPQLLTLYEKHGVADDIRICGTTDILFNDNNLMFKIASALVESPLISLL